ITGEAIDVGEAQSRAAENARNGGPDMFLGEGWNRSIEDYAETLRIDIPAHDIERGGPSVLAAHLHRCEAGLAGAQHAGRGAVAEEGGRDNIRLGKFVEAESQRAYFDADHQHDRAGARLREARGDRKPGHAARAAKAEDGHALNIGAKTHARGGARFKTGRRDARR